MPIAEIYSSISGALHVAWTDGTGSSSIVTMWAPKGIVVGWIAVLPDSRSSNGWPFSSETGLSPSFQMRGLETISPTRQSGRGPDSSLIRVFTRFWALRIVTQWSVYVLMVCAIGTLGIFCRVYQHIIRYTLRGKMLTGLSLYHWSYITCRKVNARDICTKLSRYYCRKVDERLIWAS